jgi:hypothetical protein
MRLFILVGIENGALPDAGRLRPSAAPTSRFLLNEFDRNAHIRQIA